MIIERHTGWFSRGLGVRCWLAQRAVLGILYQDHRWRVLIADGDGYAIQRLHPWQLDALLSAWFSPLPPPSPEVMSDEAILKALVARVFTGKNWLLR